MVKVYHNSEFLVYNIHPTLESLKKGHFECVATVETDDLQMAFQLTNNIDQPWHLNTNVKATARVNRSTSVGDLLQFNEKFYVVESFGFKELTPQDECGLTFFLPAPPENPTPVQWKEYGVPGIEKLMEKGYKYVVQFKENDKLFGDPLAFKTTHDISSFMWSYPNMKMLWTRRLRDHFDILTDRPYSKFKTYESGD